MLTLTFLNHRVKRVQFILNFRTFQFLDYTFLLKKKGLKYLCVAKLMKIERICFFNFMALLCFFGLYSVYL
ncbi:hypothetical protein M2132_000986 [Dysgonomonas sp. PH5-45]|nr:hypothetical protein [Dysgonomonas sp. PH5-45]MDH6387555.1 hypothetical protein [Dysgonomonas sp. PH5-37]